MNVSKIFFRNHKKMKYYFFKNAVKQTKKGKNGKNKKRILYPEEKKD